MVTPLLICGAECGIAAAGTAPPAGTIRHWSNVFGTAPTVVTSGPSPMRSTRCYRFNTANATSGLTHTYASAIASPATTVARFYAYFTTFSAGNNHSLWSTGNGLGAYFDVGTSSVFAGGGAVTLGATGVAITTGQWYRIDVKCVAGATRTVDVQVDGVACGQFTSSGALSETTCSLGTGSLVTADWYADDYIVSSTGADYPIGAGKVVGLYPNADGGHNFNLAGDFIYEAAGGNVATSATDTWTHLQNPLSTTIGNFMNAAAPATSEYLCWTLDNLPADVLTINGVAAVGTFHAASTTACAHDLLFVDDSATSGTTVVNELALLGSWGAGVFGTGVDLSETTIVVPYKVGATGASTGAWTITNVNDLAAIFGGTDVNPDAYCDGVCLEVDYVPATFLAHPPLVVLQAVSRSVVR